jgi:hypothetical protein
LIRSITHRAHQQPRPIAAARLAPQTTPTTQASKQRVACLKDRLANESDLSSQPTRRYVHHHHRTPPRRNVTSPSCDAAILPRARGLVYAPAVGVDRALLRARESPLNTSGCQDENRHDVRPRRHYTASAYDGSAHGRRIVAVQSQSLHRV